MSKDILTLAKWLPCDIAEYDSLFMNCKELNTTCLNLIHRLSDLEDIALTIEALVECFNTTFSKLNANKLHETLEIKLKMCKKQLWLVKLKLTYFTQELINEIAYLFIYYGENLLLLTLRISLSYNNLLCMDKNFEIQECLSICNNTCPYLMFPFRKISVTRLLQIVALNRAELCCHKLIDCLLETYKMFESPYDDDGDDKSENSSLEIYMTLTKHMSPQMRVANDEDKKDTIETIGDNSFTNLEELILHEEKNVVDLLTVTLKAAPIMLGSDGVKKSKSSGITKISTKAREKVLEYYEQILWGEVGNYLEHIVLWWAACPLSSRSPQSSQHLREWINQFTHTGNIPLVVVSALTCLADALGVHVTSTSWDENFRLALVASKTSYNPETGNFFSEVLQNLVMLSNQCEVTPDWIIGAPLDELPLVEQIPILHRLDHSVHMTRLWAAYESKKIANTWNVKAFFAIIHDDIASCLNQLDHLKMTDHTIEIEKKGLGVQVEVCALMRAKLASEINVNIEKLKNTPKECVEGLASVCRTICLANLKMLYPPSSYWKQSGSVVPENFEPLCQQISESNVNTCVRSN
ncbi:hypothetical protein NQ317_015900 [Molorchus minor]|uniref:Coiled-coil protein 142 C-terminal domain-containing protein n=1 Tax=Molorchus minor TaxID=1323400 RepID=A0ABQ9JEN3_9CUCU|nr:hypothetical protein NQ317_015900 [Molorchus minor]